MKLGKTLAHSQRSKRNASDTWCQNQMPILQSCSRNVAHFAIALHEQLLCHDTKMRPSPLKATISANAVKIS
jgi:hypothetical protein